MTKPLIVACALVSIPAIFGTSASYGADLSNRVTPIPVAPLAFTWTGAYVGVNAGYAFVSGASSTITGNDPGLQLDANIGLRPNRGKTESDGFTGGGQVGYNYQLGMLLLGGHVVVGIESDAAYTDLHRTAAYFSDRESDFATRTNFIGTARGRLGYAFDNVLAYGTGGFAYGNVEDGASFLNGAGRQIYNGNLDRIRTGFAFGGGVEMAIAPPSFLNVFGSNAVTIKGEFIRYELGPDDLLIANNMGIDPGYSQHLRAAGNIVRVGINYKFGALVAPPVVARY